MGDGAFRLINAPGGGPSDDPDGDGMTNLAEFRAGTDPMDGQSALRVTGIGAVGGQLHVSFSTVAGKKYRVESSANLNPGSWSTVADNVAGTGGSVDVAVLPLTNSPTFLRVTLLISN